MKKCFKAIGILLGLVILIVISYLAYVYFSYDRIEDNLSVVPVNENVLESNVSVGHEYTILTQNIGFGAYVKDFSFFMDGGKESRARSEELVLDVFDMACGTIMPYNPDFALFQEVDTDSTRSCHIDETKLIDDWFEGYSKLFGNNYHSAYLMYPLYMPHGASVSGLYTVSRAEITSGLRIQLPVSESFSKLIDLDRAYTKSRITVDNGKELIIFNTHMSAYAAGTVRDDQYSKLLADIQSEYDNGNYCICGGDFNADFTGNSVAALNNGLVTDMGWAQPFDDALIGEHVIKCTNYSDGIILPTCRNCDKPYEDGDFTLIVDGFMITDNVEMTYLENIQTGFEYSDHNPVVMRFVLK